MRAKISVQPRYARPNPNGLQSLTHNVPTYVKLQQAYVSEAVTKWGSWDNIGYQGPGERQGSTTPYISTTTNFAYVDGLSADTSDLGTAAAGWGAYNLTKLNDCEAQNKPSSAATMDAPWYVSVAKASGSAAAGADAVKFEAKASDKCKILTTAFEKIGK